MDEQGFEPHLPLGKTNRLSSSASNSWEKQSGFRPTQIRRPIHSSVLQPGKQGHSLHPVQWLSSGIWNLRSIVPALMHLLVLLSWDVPLQLCSVRFSRRGSCCWCPGCPPSHHTNVSASLSSGHEFFSPHSAQTMGFKGNTVLFCGGGGYIFFKLNF